MATGILAGAFTILSQPITIIGTTFIRWCY